MKYTVKVNGKTRSVRKLFSAQVIIYNAMLDECLKYDLPDDKLKDIALSTKFNIEPKEFIFEKIKIEYFCLPETIGDRYFLENDLTD